MRGNFEKLFKIRRVEKGSTKKQKSTATVGYNTLWCIRCKDCGHIHFMWDTELYVKLCPVCSGCGITTKKPEELKEQIWKLNRRLFSEFKNRNLLTSEENALLVGLRETRFQSQLDILISSWFSVDSAPKRKKYWCISTRGKALLQNADFIEMLEACYNLVRL